MYFILINRITQNINKEHEIPLIEIKWIWLQLNAFTTFYDLMHETVIGTFFWAVLKTKFTVRYLKHPFITEDQQTTKNNNRWDECSASKHEIQIATLNTDCEHMI